LKSIELEVHPGEIVTILGSNGAGKTTTLRAISGLVKAKPGSSIQFFDQELVGMSPDKIVRQGISHVPEGRRVFPQMTVLENLELGAFSKGPKFDTRDTLDFVYSLFPRLKERLSQKAGTFSGGEQQMLAISRALMSEPKYLLMDEPSMGIAPVIVDEIFDTIVKLNKEKNLTIILVEQNATMALSIAHRAYVLETGHVTLSGEAKDLANNEEVRKAYLGL